jgi:hypothetical protein
MRRPARPFTVEIKSSRRSSQRAAPALTGLPRTAPPPQHLWSGNRQDQDSTKDRSPASLAALDEANRLFAKLKARPVPAQSPDPRPPEGVSVQAQQPAFKADEPKADPPGRVQEAGRRGSILPDLRTAPASEAPPQVTEQRTVSRKPPRAQRKRITPPQPSMEFEEQMASDPVSTRPREPAVEEVNLSGEFEIVAVKQPAATGATPNERSAKPRRFGRALDQSWVYRAALRKAKRRGEPPPGRAAPRRKRT